MIRCIAIDDEPIALSIIQEHCNRYGDIDLQCFTSPVAGMEAVMRTKPDIVFLDIEMQSHNGLTLARELPIGTCLIFTTAYAGYAIEGFNVDAVDFLHKPIFYSRFEQAMGKARRYLSPSPECGSIKAITLKSSHKNVLINLNDIIVVEAMDNYVKIHRRNLPMIMSQITMKELESMLPGSTFIRVHRSYIVSIQMIQKYSNRAIFMQEFPRPIPVGRKFIQSLSQINNVLSK